MRGGYPGVLCSKRLRRQNWPMTPSKRQNAEVRLRVHGYALGLSTNVPVCGNRPAKSGTSIILQIELG